MLYRNKKTGAVIRSQCRISGANWEEVKASAGKSAAAQEKTETKANAQEKTETKAAAKTPGKGKK